MPSTARHKAALLHGKAGSASRARDGRRKAIDAKDKFIFSVVYLNT